MAKVCPELYLVLFADDTNIFAKAENPLELFTKVNQGLQKLAKWFKCNKLTLNLKKTEYVYFSERGHKQEPLGGLKIGNEAIRRVKGARFLGVWVDEGLKWATHIENVRARIGRLVVVLGRASAVLGGNCLRMLYNALVLPHLQYCLLVWGDFQGSRNMTTCVSLLRLQKRLVGILTGNRGRYHSDPLFAGLGILKVGDLYRQQLRLYTWKFWNDKLPENQNYLLNKVSEVHKYNTRSAGTGLHLQTHDHKSMGYRAPKEWETVAKTVRESKSLTGFTKKSREEFILGYKAFQCVVQNCYVCSRGAGQE